MKQLQEQLLRETQLNLLCKQKLRQNLVFSQDGNGEDSIIGPSMQNVRASSKNGSNNSPYGSPMIQPSRKFFPDKNNPSSKQQQQSRSGIDDDAPDGSMLQDAPLVVAQPTITPADAAPTPGKNRICFVSAMGVVLPSSVSSVWFLEKLLQWF